MVFATFQKSAPFGVLVALLSLNDNCRTLVRDNSDRILLWSDCREGKRARETTCDQGRSHGRFFAVEVSTEKGEELDRLSSSTHLFIGLRWFQTSNNISFSLDDPCPLFYNWVVFWSSWDKQLWLFWLDCDRQVFQLLCTISYSQDIVTSLFERKDITETHSCFSCRFLCDSVMSQHNLTIS